MPKTLSLPHQALPIWAEASVAVSADGEPNPTVWGQEPTRIHEILTTPADDPIYFNGKIVRYQNEQSAPGCRDVGTTYFDYPEPPRRGTVDEAIADSAVAVLGRVTDKAYGFSSGQPGQLFQIEPVRSYGYPLTQARYYFFVPVGRFTVGGVTICKTDERYAEPPDVGSEVFLFVGKPEDTTGVYFFVYSAGDVVPVDPDGSLRLPPQYTANEQQGTAPRASALRTRSDLLARIQALRANWRLGGAPAVPGRDSAVHWK
ncbi:MAG TPA: hypothetical protein VN999_08995 [Thermoanaerobaculia bacterium]|nr:hypothetical protein [Thermoanaerobaculia bacterium]